MRASTATQLGGSKNCINGKKLDLEERSFLGANLPYPYPPPPPPLCFRLPRNNAWPCMRPFPPRPQQTRHEELQEAHYARCPQKLRDGAKAGEWALGGRQEVEGRRHIHTYIYEHGIALLQRIEVSRDGLGLSCWHRPELCARASTAADAGRPLENLTGSRASNNNHDGLLIYGG